MKKRVGSLSIIIFFITTHLSAADADGGKAVAEMRAPSPEVLQWLPKLKTLPTGDECWPDWRHDFGVGEEVAYDGSLHRLAGDADGFTELLVLLEMDVHAVSAVLSKDGSTALHHAVAADLYDHCLLLIMFGANPQVRDSAAMRPIDYCQATATGERIKEMLEKIEAALDVWFVPPAPVVPVGMRAPAMAMAVHVPDEYRRMFDIIAVYRAKKRPACVPQ